MAGLDLEVWQGLALFQAYREQIVEFGGTVGSTRIGGGNANPIHAAFWHTDGDDREPGWPPCLQLLTTHHNA